MRNKGNWDFQEKKEKRNCHTEIVLEQTDGRTPGFWF